MNKRLVHVFDENDQSLSERDRALKKTKQSRRDFMAFGGSLLLGLSLAACRKEEQGRALKYDKGTYQGKADESLSEDDLTALRQRATLQRQ